MTVPPKKKLIVKKTITPKLKDPGLVFYKPAVRDMIKRGNLAQMKSMLKNVKSLQGGGLDALALDLEKAIKRAQ